MHSNELEAMCGMKCYCSFWFHSEVKLKCSLYSGEPQWPFGPLIYLCKANLFWNFDLQSDYTVCNGALLLLTWLCQQLCMIKLYWISYWFAAFFDQMCNFCTTYENAGIFRLWLSFKPLIAMYRAEYVEVGCQAIVILLAVVTCID